MSGVLIAGLGNVFLGDDGFGVEVAQRMLARPLPAGVHVEDFGIRGIDLTYALLDGVDTAILVDATQRGGPPGSLYVIEPQPESEVQPSALLFSPHEMDPGKVLRVVNLLGGACERIVLVGCEPESFGTEAEQEGRIGLSEPVAAAVDKAIELIESMLAHALEAKMPSNRRVIEA